MAVLGGLKDPKLRGEYQQVEFVPFDPVSKRTEATIKDSDGKTFFVTKGTPQVIFAMAKLAGDELAKAEKIIVDLAAKGYRTLGVARAETEGEWKLLGILPLFDPPRVDSKETIAEAEAYGVSVKMVTGDNAAIAAEISGQLGLGTHIQAGDGPVHGRRHQGADSAGRGRAGGEGRRLRPGLSRAQICHRQGLAAARASGGHDRRRRQRRPGLKQADVGIAVSGATDAARAAAA